MYLLYSLVLSLLFLALLPYFVYQAARRGKYSGSFKERMGYLPAPLRADDRKTIWVHAVSVGEFLAARSLISRLRSDLPGARIVVSTTTLTGQQLARSHSHLFDAALYFPFDWKFSVRRSLDTIKPSVVVILETELWPNFLRECRRRDIGTVLANGRISPRSFRRYQLLGRAFKKAIQDISLLVMQSEADAELARQLGAAADLVRVCGNLKYDQEASETDDSNKQSGTLRGLEDRSVLVVLIASSDCRRQHCPGRRGNAARGARRNTQTSGLADAQLLLAPRHPERFDEVARLIARSGFTILRRSESLARSGYSVAADIAQEPAIDSRKPVLPSADQPVDVLLLDTIGELASVYRFAEVVFVGGSLVPRGGHNIIEPAAFAKPIVVGPHTDNFRQIVSDFVNADALVQIDAGDDVSLLARELIHLLSDREYGRAMGERGRDILKSNRGATVCTVEMIKEVVIGH